MSVAQPYTGRKKKATAREQKTYLVSSIGALEVVNPFLSYLLTYIEFQSDISGMVIPRPPPPFHLHLHLYNPSLLPS